MSGPADATSIIEGPVVLLVGSLACAGYLLFELLSARRRIRALNHHPVRVELDGREVAAALIRHRRRNGGLS